MVKGTSGGRGAPSPQPSTTSTTSTSTMSTTSTVNPASYALALGQCGFCGGRNEAEGWSANSCLRHRQPNLAPLSIPPSLLPPRGHGRVLSPRGNFLGYGPPPDFLFIFKPCQRVGHSPGHLVWTETSLRARRGEQTALSSRPREKG